MRTIVHLSDLHFGRTDPAVLQPLLAAVDASRPDCVVVSGDLTQRARASEFRQARDFLNRMPQPQVVVPGNHDVPLYRVWERWFDALGKYRRYIASDIETTFIDAEIAVLGINTARALTFKGGRINTAQIASVQRQLAALPQGVTKIVVTHHPFDLPDAADAAGTSDASHAPHEHGVVGRAPSAIAAFARSGVDLLLAGHLHTSHAGNTSGHHDLPGYAALVVQAGTATSTRGRGEANAFNVLRIDTAAVAVERHCWSAPAGAFQLDTTEHFRRDGGRWFAV